MEALRNYLHILTQVEEVRECDLDLEKAALYILKEVDSNAEYRNRTRHGSVPHKWGIIGRKNLVRVPEQRLSITNEQAERIKAIVLFHLDYQLEFLEYTPNGKMRQKKLRRLMWKVEHNFDVALHMLPWHVLAQIQGVVDVQQ